MSFLAHLARSSHGNDGTQRQARLFQFRTATPRGTFVPMGIPSAAFPWLAGTSMARPAAMASLAFSPSKSGEKTKKTIKTENPTAKLLIGMGVTWVFELCFGNYLEFVKINKQTTGMSYPQITRNIVQHKGLIGVLDGFFPWGTLQALSKGGSFAYGQALAQKNLAEYTSLSPDVADVLSGGIGGCFQGFFLSPLLLLKTRVMTDPAFRATGSFMETTAQSSRIGLRVIREEGVLALGKGLPVFVFKRFFDWTTRYLFVVWCQNAYRMAINETGPGSRKLSTAEASMCAVSGGAIRFVSSLLFSFLSLSLSLFFLSFLPLPLSPGSAVVTLPVDVVVAQIQQASKAGAAVSPFEFFREQYKAKGMSGITDAATRGSFARITVSVSIVSLFLCLFSLSLCLSLSACAYVCLVFIIFLYLTHFLTYIFIFYSHLTRATARCPDRLGHENRQLEGLRHALQPGSRRGLGLRNMN